MTPSKPWPDEALSRQAGSIGPAVLELIDSEMRWVHRRVERIELLNATQITRTVAADMTVPAALQTALGLYADEADRKPWNPAGRFVVPLGLLPKAPLQDFALIPADVHRMTAEQTSRVLAAALAPYARLCGAPPDRVLTLARRIIRSERPEPQLLREFAQLLDEAHGGDEAARRRLQRLVGALNDGYLLLVAINADAGMPVRVCYVHRQAVEVKVGEVTDPPLVVELRLPHASGPGPGYRVEVVAPEGLEIETASIVAVEGTARRPVDSVNPEPGGGAFVQLTAPSAARRPAIAGVLVTFGWPRGGIHHIALIAAAVSTTALATATALSYWLDEHLKGSSAGTLLAAPALVTGLVLGFATTRVTSAAANRLRSAALVIALLGVTGALAVSLFGESTSHLNLRHGVLVGLTVLSLLLTGGFPLTATLRRRAAVPLKDAS